MHKTNIQVIEMLDIERPNDFYKQSIDPLVGYLKQGALYLNKMTGKPIEECLDFIRTVPIRDPKVVINTRDENTGDKHEDVTTLRMYLKACKDEDLVIAPTLTGYLPAKEKRSFLGRFIIKKMKQRGIYKEKMFHAKMEEDKIGESTYKALQSCAKEINNSASGAQTVPTNPICNPSAHPTLTSGCRTATSYANIHNEQFLAGNRAYFSYQDVINSIMGLITMYNHDDVKKAIDTFNLHIPTPEEVWDTVNYSLKKYNPSSVTNKKIIDLIEKLTPTERAVVVYTYDLKHLAKYNPELIKTFLVRMSIVPEKVEGDYTDKFKKSSSDIKTMILFQNGFKFKGMKTEDILKVEENKDMLDRCAKNIEETLTWFESIVNAFWLPPVQLINNAYADFVRREVVPVSDTDSTIFTNQEWTKFVTGSYNFDEMSFRVGNTTTYITAKIVAHHLKAMSVNFNIDRSEITRIKMKNEYYFTTMLLTDVAKHYACLKWGQEGNILPEFEPEIKGVNLRNSAWPAEIYTEFSSYITGLLEKTSKGEKLSRKEVIGPVLDIENRLIDQIKSGKSTLYNKVPVNQESAYKNPGSSPYRSYYFWNKVFAPKYGPCPEPPYIGVKVPVNLPNAKSIETFIKSIEDKDLARRFEEYTKELNKKDYTMFILPAPVLESTGVPLELVSVIDKDTLLSNVTGGYYLTLAAFGLYPRDKDYTISLINVFDRDSILSH